MNERKQIHVIVSGRVQGVGFRYYTKEIATAYGLNGMVKNLPDGRVEIVAEGDEKDLKEFLSKVKDGPTSLSHVSNVQVDWRQAFGNYHGFRIEY